MRGKYLTRWANQSVTQSYYMCLTDSYKGDLSVIFLILQAIYVFEGTIVIFLIFLSKLKKFFVGVAPVYAQTKCNLNDNICKFNGAKL